MSRRTRTMVVLLSAGALAGGGTASTAQAHHHHGRGHHHHHWGHRHGDRFARIASELGVTKDQLKAAIEAVKAQDPQSKDAFVAALAQQLNVPEDKVAAAFSCDHGDNDND
jgi:Spy/CpxP family protein refolding chaperone